ncbi:MAG TPA: hypothetical protein VFB07_11150 [Vicinamibacterales bacterium]|nr:hypothetical protein [Vicinamibacterales bacterium]
MDRKSRRQSDARRSPAPILVVPRQTPDEIERRTQIREALHDAKAITVRPRGRHKRAS